MATRRGVREGGNEIVRDSIPGMDQVPTTETANLLNSFTNIWARAGIGFNWFLDNREKPQSMERIVGLRQCRKRPHR